MNNVWRKQDNREEEERRRGKEKEDQILREELKNVKEILMKGTQLHDEQKGTLIMNKQQLILLVHTKPFVVPYPI